MVEQRLYMSSPKQQAFVIKFLDTFNPTKPSVKLMEHLESIVLPKSGYLNVSTRGKKLIELELDALDYLAYRCKQCPEDIKLMAKVLYFITWYEELSTTGDDEDIITYEKLFREHFKTYKIDFDTIFNGSEENVNVIIGDEKVVPIAEPILDVSTKPVKSTDTIKPSNSFIKLRDIDKSENCANTHCTSKRRFPGLLSVNKDGYCENCHNSHLESF
jgi:hypothetical protein